MTTKQICSILMLCVIVSCGANEKFKTVKIGKQTWMVENLNTEYFNNGDKIPQVEDESEWSKLTSPAWCYYENKEENGMKYGKLYNWYAINDSRKIAPKGWHIPIVEEWEILTTFLGGEKIAGEKMKSSTGWENNGNGTNESGFCGLPGGLRSQGTDSKYGYFEVGFMGNWWTADPEEKFYGLIFNRNDSWMSHGAFREYGLSARCIKD